MLSKNIYYFFLSNMSSTELHHAKKEKHLQNTKNSQFTNLKMHRRKFYIKFYKILSFIKWGKKKEFKKETFFFFKNVLQKHTAAHQSKCVKLQTLYAK